MNKELHDKGLAVRKEVLGAEYVEKSLGAADDFNRPFQELVTEYCWGAVWTRDGLTRQSRSILNLGMLSALGRSHELKLHIKGALTNGVTREEVSEILLHADVYCCAPAAVDAFRSMREVFAAADAKP